MQILIVGVGALGGTIAARAIRSGLPVRLAARNNDSAKALRRSGLRVSGIGGEVRADAIDVAAVEDYGKGDQFDLILLATKAQDALEVAPHVLGLLAPEGVILPIQNGGVARALADRLGEDKSVHSVRKPKCDASSVREAHFLSIDGRMLCLFGIGIS